MRFRSLALAAAASLALATPALAGPTEDFHALMDEYWAAYLKDKPLSASQAGVTTYDRQLGVLTLAEFDRQAAEAQAFLDRLDAHRRRPRCRRRTRPTTASSSGRCRDAVEGQPLRRAADALFVARQLSPGYAGTWRAASRSGPMPIMTIISRGSTKVPGADGAIRRDQPPRRRARASSSRASRWAISPRRSPGSSPPTRPNRASMRRSPRREPASIGAEDWAALQARAATLITARSIPPTSDWAEIYRTELAGKCRQSVGVSEPCRRARNITRSWSASRPPPT